jgi:hypothetical protein
MMMNIGRIANIYKVFTGNDGSISLTSGKWFSSHFSWGAFYYCVLFPFPFPFVAGVSRTGVPHVFPLSTMHSAWQPQLRELLHQHAPTVGGILQHSGPEEVASQSTRPISQGFVRRRYPILSLLVAPSAAPRATQDAANLQ